MKVRPFFHSLYWKLSAVFLILLCLVGAAYTYLTLFSSEMYFAETSQRINATLAQHIVEEIQPVFIDGQPNRVLLTDLFHSVMVVNPSVEVYLIDAEGGILAFAAPPEKVTLKSVSLVPIRQFIESGAQQLVLGDNPRDAARPKVFSAAEVVQDGRLQGYIYVILRGEEFDSIAERIRNSHILSLGLKGLLLSILAAGTIGLFALALVTRKLRRLTRSAVAFKEGHYTERVTITSNDELDELGRAFNAMASALARHVEELKNTDALRRDLIANVSHDLRTPLASMRGYLETVLMKDNELSPGERKKYLTIILDNTDRLGKLVRDLFELSKLEAHETQPVPELFSIVELVNDIILKFSPIAEQKRISLVAGVEEQLPRVYADIGLIERVFQNLIENAITHTPDNGRVSIGLSRVDSKVEVAIEDTGSGIASDALPYVFDRFYRSRGKGQGGGAGLGLAIVKKILEAHGESITVESKVNEGTLFYFRLSTIAPEETAPHKSAAEASRDGQLESAVMKGRQV